MKVCLDTNILVSGIYWGGLPGTMLDLWAQGHFALMVSPTILEEYIRVFEEMGQRFKAKDTEKWLSAITEKSSIILPHTESKKWSRDKDDDKFIACCQAGEADYLVTGDKDLLVLNGQFLFEILKPRQFLAKAR